MLMIMADINTVEGKKRRDDIKRRKRLTKHKKKKRDYAFNMASSENCDVLLL